MHRLSLRLTLGFGAGALSHLIFQGVLGLGLQAAQLRSEPAWSFAPAPPFGVPLTLNLMFWDGLWGLLYAAFEPRLRRELGPIGRGLVLGGASLLVYWFVVLPLKGAGPSGDPATVALQVLYDMVFGLGTVGLYAGGLGVLPAVGRPGGSTRR